MTGSFEGTRENILHIHITGLSLFSPILLECQLATLVGDGYCHDYTNNRHCEFDRGDCCGPCVNKEYCSECICKKSGADVGITNPLVGDGFCHDSTNNHDCNFDGGDCCGPCINNKYCQDCQCIGEHFGDAQNNDFFADGVCQDDINLDQCNYDGFDCCSSSSNKEYCSQCDCKGIINHQISLNHSFPDFILKFENLKKQIFIMLVFNDTILCDNIQLFTSE